MLDFTPVWRGEKTLADLSAGLQAADLHTLTDEVLDAISDLLKDATDADIVFVPEDPGAEDPSATSQDEANIAWTAAHIIVHTTASSEEGAAIGTTLARGVEVEGRSRYETHWESITTVAQLQARLAESRRMRHALLNAWPDQPNLEHSYTPIPRFGPMNAVARFLLGLAHEQGHLDQLAEALRQARAARGA